MIQFEKVMEVRWADCDPNGHMRHSAYYDLGGHLRIRFIEHLGYSTEKMAENNFGPILFTEQCAFIKEIKPGDSLKVNMLKGAMNEEMSRWVLHHEIFNQHGDKCAHITIKGAWLDLIERKLTVPPAEMKGFHDLPEGEAYQYKK